MKYVYLLSEHDEYGAENVVATLDRDKLPLLIEQNWSHVDAPWKAEALDGLNRHLEKTDEELSTRKSGHHCHCGWGGMQLHVIRLS